MISPRTLVATLALVAVCSVDAHSKLIKPQPHYKNPGGANSPSGLIQGNSVLTPPAGKSFSTDPDSNAAAFVAAFKSSGKYSSLKDLILKNQKLSSGASAECGFADLAGATPQPLPAMVEWDEFTSSHTGPCEVWCDNQLAFQDDYCSKNFKGNPAKLPYDVSKCTGAKVLTSYWIALHTAEWQVYTGCAPLSGSSAGGSSGATGGATGGNTGGTTGGTTGGNTGGNSGGATSGNGGGNSGASTGGNSDAATSDNDSTSGGGAAGGNSAATTTKPSTNGGGNTGNSGGGNMGNMGNMSGNSKPANSGGSNGNSNTTTKPANNGGNNNNNNNKPANNGGNNGQSNNGQGGSRPTGWGNWGNGGQGRSGGNTNGNVRAGW